MKKREPGLKPLRNAGLAAIFVAGTVGASALYGQILHQGAQPGAELDARADSAPDDVHWQLPPPPADLAASDEATPMAPAGAPPASTLAPTPTPAVDPALSTASAAGATALPVPPPAPGPEPDLASMPAKAVEPPAALTALDAGAAHGEAPAPATASLTQAPAGTLPSTTPTAAALPQTSTTPATPTPAAEAKSAPEPATTQVAPAPVPPPPHPAVKPATPRKKTAQAARPRASKSAQALSRPTPLPPSHPVEARLQADEMQAGPAHVDALQPPLPILPDPAPRPRRRSPVVSSMVDGVTYVGGRLASMVRGD